ncbi:hypothetical protein G6645_09180 [Polynucleobacter paneuropaeus]|jgi:dolichyl-phosphate-mannose--protein O-mannosyl transferase|nr:hypothetical protein [Polynucleobacter paneuropaeus]MBT8532739.1 hypothetical protein [Polynucleobacter paneuropaeus]MBT8602953.1 hypothetical protein [Polynucleobacter paneuropaeus]MBT8624905.1 hypothetical protein [Polynucleobacter paneuropaeus]MBT8630458.1 hypothetical protein [Polynucleobacter paneuropaeus]
MQKILVAIIALYTGLIAIACLSKGVVKLMAHGYMSSQDFLYPAKIIFVVIAAYVFIYLSKHLKAKPESESTLKFLVVLSPFRLGILVVATAFVIYQQGFGFGGAIGWLVGNW